VNVLLLEDNGFASEMLKAVLTDDGHTVFDAFNTNDATSYWKSEEIGCIVLDLNMSTKWLSEGQRKRCDGGALTGWVWFEDEVLKTKKGTMMHARTVIFSDYRDRLVASVDASELDGIEIVPKRGESSNFERVLQAVRRIERTGSR